MRSRKPKQPPRYAVIMAGGHGTRFWPAARTHRPKQFLPLHGENSFLQETVRRVLPLFGWQRLLVVTGPEHAAQVAAHLPDLDPRHLLVEPAPRNTAACLSLAAEWLTQHVGEATMMAMPADHVVRDAAGLRRALRQAESLAVAGANLVVLGIEPSRPDSGFGYVDCGASIDGTANASWVRRFHEKPEIRVARRYAASGRHLWNAGIFVWTLSTFRAAMAQCAPVLSTTLSGAFDAEGRLEARVARRYRRLPKLPIDIALMQPITAIEHPAARVAVVRADFDWLDAGSWEAMHGLWDTDANGNAARGNAVLLESRGCVVAGSKRLTVLLGIEDLVVVDTEDALLICPRSRAQDVRSIPDELRRRARANYT